MPPPNLPPIAKRHKTAQKAQDRVSKFHASRKWGKIRDSYRQLQPICERCRHLGQITKASTEKLSVHHIVMLANDYELRDSEENLLTLCAPCHGHFTVLERSGKAYLAEIQGKEIKNEISM